MSLSPVGRYVEVAGEGRHLAKARGFLTVSSGHEVLGRVALDDIAAVIVTGPGNSISCPLIAALSKRGTPLVVCETNFQPTVILWPIQGHYQQQRRMESQVEATRPLRKRLWSEIIAFKIRAQAATLATHGRPVQRLDQLAATIRSGDPENAEAQAARLYWPALLGSTFRRDTDAPGVNSLLNYAYAVLRAATARAIVAAGLHPGIGIFHRHPNNPMPLADDLMEPFRPILDHAVMALVAGGEITISSAAKKKLVEALLIDLPSPEGTSPLSTVIMRFAASVAESFVARKPMLYPLQVKSLHLQPTVALGAPG